MSIAIGSGNGNGANSSGDCEGGAMARTVSALLGGSGAAEVCRAELWSHLLPIKRVWISALATPVSRIVEDFGEACARGRGFPNS